MTPLVIVICSSIHTDKFRDSLLGPKRLGQSLAKGHLVDLIRDLICKRSPQFYKSSPNDPAVFAMIGDQINQDQNSQENQYTRCGFHRKRLLDRTSSTEPSAPSRQGSVTPRQQLVQHVDFVISNAGLDIGERRLRVNAVQFYCAPTASIRPMS